MFRLLAATTPDERMTALERFIEFWYGPCSPGFGEPDAPTMYPDLPGSLRRFYAFAGRWPSPDPQGDEDFFYTGHGGHHLLPLDAVGPDGDGAYQSARRGLPDAEPPAPPDQDRG